MCFSKSWNEAEINTRIKKGMFVWRNQIMREIKKIKKLSFTKSVNESSRKPFECDERILKQLETILKPKVKISYFF
jgi:hypothetical protein